MADALLSASLQVLFEKLLSPELTNFFWAQKLSQELLTDFKRKLLVVHKALNDAEVKQFSDPLVKEWLVQVKDVVYHAEDLLDEIATEALRCEIEAAEVRTGGIYQVLNKISTRVKAPFANQSMESRVKGLMTRLENIAKEKVELELKEGDGEKLSPKLPSSSLKDDSVVYGRDEIKEELVKWLRSDKETAAANNVIDVMSIVGMGGSGKTTLAQLLYNHKRVKKHFHLKAWVCVSTEFHVIGVTKSILEAIGCKPTSDASLDLLQRQLEDKLGNKKLLLVLDDVWDVKSLDQESWGTLRTPLLAAAQGSKIVVTSRSVTVAKVMRAIHTHQLETLTDKPSWSLFTKLAFPNGDSCAYPQLGPIGREIVKKCQGLPLAVKALGSLLSSNRERRDWEEILNSETWHSQTDHEILPSLILSYQHLSPPVKRCFAYCSIFPKDYEFHKEKLILLWMAEGFLHSEQSNGRMEEVGDSYFNELLAKSFLQKCIREEESYFVMHDLIHDLAQNISQEFCVRLEDYKVQKISDKARHFLYFNSDYDRDVVFENFEPVGEAKHLRTVLEVNRLCRGPFYRLSTRVLQNILPKFKSLRVLSLCEYWITDVPDSIHNLKQLRYLDLSRTMIKRLPESICCLCNLQTMMLSKCRFLVELPSKMGKLINLRYLDISGPNSLEEMPNDIGQLKSLQKLSNFTVGKESGFRFGELWKLSEIRGRLEISNMENVVGVEDALQANMKDKKYLDELSLNWSRGISHDAIQDDILNRLTPHPNLKKLSIGGYPGLTFPDWLGDGSLSNLVSLQLSNCGNCSTLPPLGQLPCLVHIKISKMSGVVMVGSEFYGNSSSSLHPSFPSLQTLSFEDMSNWEKWLCCGEFPRLQELSIRLCPKLTGELPMHLSSLQELNLKDCPQLLVPTLNVPAARELQLKRQTCGFTASQTSEIEISDVSQLKQLPLVPHYLYIRKCDSVESLLEEEILQTNMYSLKICDCSFYKSPNKVGLPTTLKSLSISDCTKLDLLLPELFRCHHPVLENLSINGGTYGNSLSLSFSISDIFPRLTDFKIIGLKGLEELCISISEGDPTSLRNLKISRCPNLVYIQLPALDSMCHEICNCSNLKLLAHTHSSLQELRLEDCPELLLHREGVPSNLRELEIQGCNQLTSQMDLDLQRLTSLTHFTITGGCEGVELFPKECLLPSSLTYLSIWGLPNLKSLDNKGLQQLTSLLHLEIWNCPELQFSTGSVLQRLISLKGLGIHWCERLQSLTEAGLHHLTTLETLSISNCPELQSLTNERLPNPLSYLNVDGCPSLEQRLQFEKGREWRYISHIPKIEINFVLF
ncbi:putative disease resistance RPP13-like protein 1 isoform X3 [Vitis riparia]|uniref:putative disease resistance RPP13-like protein 1 isoform X3 n=1 Tax=Vitis riparia TaxID=96939 RepID=UPI00155AFE53|nr:putative disease resistance RPP13-like protein 1 isoform X3 [Vitis riparia]